MTTLGLDRFGRDAHEQFAKLLDAPATVTGAIDPAMGSLAQVANALRTAGRVTTPAAPDPAFRAALRQRLVAVATVQAVEPTVAIAREHGARAAVGHRMHRRIVALGGSVAIVTSLVGVGIAATRSLPGDPFYGIKRSAEGVQLWAASGDFAKGKRHLEFARTRLAEAEALPPNSSHLASTLAAMNAQTTDGSRELIAAYQSTKSVAPLAYLVTFSHEQVAGLLGLAPTLPVALRVQEMKSIQLINSVVNQVDSVSKGVCILCATTPGGTSSPSGHQTTPPAVSLFGTSPKPTSSHKSSPTPTPSAPAVGLPTPTASRVVPTSPGSLPTSKRVILPLPSLTATLPGLPLHHHKHSTPPLPLPSLPPLPVVSSLLPGL